MVTLEMVDDALKEEVAEECEKYGKVMVLLKIHLNLRDFIKFAGKELCGVFDEKPQH